MTPALSAVFFDLGGTLFHHLPPEATIDNLRWALESAGVAPSDEAILTSYLSIRAELEQQYADRRFFLHRDLVRDAARHFFDRFLESQAPAAARDHFPDAFYALQRSAVTEHLRPREEAAHVLQTLRAWGYFVAIVSNIDEDYLGPLLAREPDIAACDLVLSSEVTRSCKPDAVIFRTALRRAHRSPEEVLFVGDSWRNDVAGGSALGFRTAWLTTDQPPERVAERARGAPDSSAPETARAALAAALASAPAAAPTMPDLNLRSLAQLLPLLAPDQC
ncbi:MAG: HAD family hydrolase [Pseudomonadota bacterium]